MPESPAFLLDKPRLRRQFAHAAATYDAVAVLQRQVADRLLERLDLVRHIPEVVVDAGSGTGYCTRALARRYRGAQVYGLDVAWAMARAARRKAGWFGPRRYVCGDIEAMPIASGSVDLVVSNLALQWCRLDTVFAEFMRVLRPGGLLMFTSFGPDTLRELRAAWAAVDSGVHVHAFLDMHDVGDALVRAGFADPVMDMENFTLTYADVYGLLRDLKHIGAGNAAHGRARGLTGKRRFARFVAAYQAMARDRRLPATYETVYGHAWAPLESRRGEGVATIPIASIGGRRR